MTIVLTVSCFLLSELLNYERGENGWQLRSLRTLLVLSIRGSKATVSWSLELRYQNMRKARQRGCSVRLGEKKSWAENERAWLLLHLPIWHFPPPPRPGLSCLTRPATSQRKHQLLDDSLDFLLPDWQTHLHPHPPSQGLWSRCPACYGGPLLAPGASHRTSSVSPVSFLAPSRLHRDVLKLPTSACWHLLDLLPEMSFSSPDPLSLISSSERPFQNLQAKWGSHIALSQSTFFSSLIRGLASLL